MDLEETITKQDFDAEMIYLFSGTQVPKFYPMFHLEI
jgi:hypothetical protein